MMASALILSTPVFAQQPSIFGSWCGVLGNGWVADTPNRDLVVGQDGKCKWDFPKRNGPGSARACNISSDGLDLITGAGSKIGLKFKDSDTLEGWFELKSAGSKIYSVTARRGACKI